MRTGGTEQLSHLLLHEVQPQRLWAARDLESASEAYAITLLPSLSRQPLFLVSQATMTTQCIVLNSERGLRARMQGEPILSLKCSQVFEDHMRPFQMNHADQGVNLGTQHALLPLA